MPFAVGVLLAAVALGGCQAEETPGGAVGPSPSASATDASPTPSASGASPSPSASVAIPPAAREKTEAGAEAFTRFFIAQSAMAWTQANPALIAALSDPSCESCASLATTAEQLKRRGHRYAAEPISVISVDALTGDGKRQNVAATIKQRAVDVVDAEGKVVSSDAAASLERTFLLHWGEGGWRVGGIA